MKGMILVFGSESTVKAAAEEYSSEFDSGWHECADEFQRMAELISASKGIPKDETYAFLTRLYGAPQFRSPAQRRWWFATHPRGELEEPESKGSSSKDRWADIMGAARSSLRGQPHLTGDELTTIINTIVEPDLTESEAERVRRLVSPERKQRLVAPPEKIPLELRTPETEELIERERPRIEEEREREKERRKERSRPPVKVKKPTGVDLAIPPLAQPGIPAMGAAKRGYANGRDFFLCHFPDASADQWRAFAQAMVLMRSGVDIKDVSKVLSDEYPEVCADEILKAAKDFVKSGRYDPYIRGISSDF